MCHNSNSSFHSKLFFHRFKQFSPYSHSSIFINNTKTRNNSVSFRG